MARLAFLGSPEAAVPSLRALVDAAHEIVLVVSQPDKRRGRGGGSEPSPVKRFALEAGLPVSDRVDDVVASGAQLGVVVAFGRIVPVRVLDVVPMVNGHFSLLPRWRGAAPVERAILAGDAATGVCIMRLEEGLDTGPVLATREVQIRNDEREHASELTRRLAVVSAEMLLDLLAHDPLPLPPGEPQVGDASYAPKIDPAELRLDFDRSVEVLERTVRLDRAWTTFRGQRLLVLDAIAHPHTTRESETLPNGTLTGTTVRARDGDLELLMLQPSGRRPLSAGDWVRGARPDTSEKLGE